MASYSSSIICSEFIGLPSYSTVTLKIKLTEAINYKAIVICVSWFNIHVIIDFLTSLDVRANPLNLEATGN